MTRVPHRAVAGIAGLALVLSLAAWVRVARFEDTLAAGDVTGQDGDAAYHFWRMQAATERFPRVPLVDQTMNWPRGGAIPWTDGFDWLGAAFARLGGARGPPGASDVALLLWPVVLGLLCVAGTMELTRLLARPDAMTAPLAAGLIEAFAPISVRFSSFGMTDHHVGETLAMLLLAIWAIRRMDAEEGSTGARAAWEAAGALAVTFALWVFSGSVLYVGIAALPLGVRVLATRRAPPALGSGALALLAGAAAATLLVLPAVAAHGRPFSFRYPSLLQPTLVALAALAIAAAVGAGRLLRERHRFLRAAVAVAAVALVAALGWAVLPELRREVIAALRDFVMARDPWLSGIEEFQSPLTATSSTPGGFGGFVHRYGFLAVLAVAALPVGVAVAWRGSAPRAMAYGCMAACLVALLLVQLRFARVAFPFLSAGSALALLGAAALLRARVPWPRAAAATPVLAVAATVLALPGLHGAAVRRPPRPMDALDAAARELLIVRAPELGRRDGVLAPWEHASQLAVRSRRPVVANGFGTFVDPASFDEVKRAYEGDESGLVAVMEAHDLGFALGGGWVLENHQPEPPGVPPVAGNPPAPNPAYMRGRPLSQLLIGGSGLPGMDLPHLERLMPVHASAAASGNLGAPVPILWVFELVPGALLAGRAGPGDRVVAEIALQERGRPHRYRAWTRAGADGSWRIRLAVPSDLRRPTVRTGPAWTVTARGISRTVSVPEAAVRSGATVEVSPP